MQESGSDLALTVIRVAIGLVLAAHGAQKVFGMFEGPGLEKWHGAVASMGFAQPRVLGTLAAFTELFGGLALAIGLYIPIAAAMLAVDMLVAIRKAHWAKGFFVQKGGYEYPLVLFIALCVIGVSPTMRYSVDVALGLFLANALWFAGVLVGGLIAVVAAAMAGRQPEGAGRTV